jgi:hypothetical protein
MRRIYSYLDIAASLDLTSISTVLCNNLFLIWDILDPVDVLGSATSMFSFDGVRRQTGEYQDRCSST